MRLFVYGTLLDGDVLRIVTGRDRAGLTPATLDGWLPASVRGASVPMLRRLPGAVTTGALLDMTDAATSRALEAYEGTGYRLMKVDVRVNDGRRVAAAVYTGVPGRLRSSGRIWKLGEWQRRQKTAFMRTTFRRGQ